MLARALLLAAKCILLFAGESLPLRESQAPAILERLMPGFYQGYLYGLAPENKVTLFAPDGHLVFAAELSGVNTEKAMVEAVAVDSNEDTAIGWIHPPHCGIEFHDKSGTLVGNLDTGAFVPAHLAYGPDHSIWVFGRQREPLASPGAKLDYPMVRRYSNEGKQTGAFLLRSLFPAGLDPGMPERQRRRITVTGDRVGLETIAGPSGDNREWVELDSNGNLLGRWKINPPATFIGVAMTADNHAYLDSFDTALNRHRLFRLNRTSGQWDSVDSHAGQLYGAQGNELVFASWRDQVMHLSWYPQP